MNKKYMIIGGGITGFTIAHCLHLNGVEHKDIMIISKDVGGQNKNSLRLGPRLLISNANTKKFVETLGIYDEPKEIKVGYAHADGTINEELSLDDFNVYCEKTNRSPSKSAMSDGLKTFKAWKWEEIHLLSKLEELYSDRVTFAELNAKEIEELSNTEGIQVISTVNLFTKDVKYSNISFFLLDETMDMIFRKVIGVNDFDYVYDVIPSSIIKRYTIFEDAIIFEVIGDVKTFYNFKYLASLKQIYSNEVVEKYGKIILEGRYGRLEHDCKLEDVIGRWI